MKHLALIHGETRIDRIRSVDKLWLLIEIYFRRCDAGHCEGSVPVV